MFGIKLCSPALIYLVFSLTQVVVDSIKGLYNVALLKFTMMVLFTLLLNILRKRIRSYLVDNRFCSFYFNVSDYKYFYFLFLG